MSSSQVDPHDKMRARDVGKVARGEQAPRPAHDFGTVSKAPPPSAVKPKPNNEGEDSSSATHFSNRKHHCSIRYYEYHRCIHEKEESSKECDKFKKAFSSLCEQEWIEKLDKEREDGSFPLPL